MIAPVSPDKIPATNAQIGLDGMRSTSKKKMAPRMNRAVSMIAKSAPFSNFIALNYFAGLPQPGHPSHPIESYLLYIYINSKQK